MIDFVKKVLITVAIVFGFIFLPLAIYYILPKFMPFIVAYFFALMLEPINQWIVKYSKFKRNVSANITYFIFLGFLLLLAYFIITKITTETLGLIKLIQKNIPIIKAWFLNLNQKLLDYIQLLPKEVSDQIKQSSTNFINKLTSVDLISNIGAHTVNITAMIPNIFILLLLIFISTYLISLNLPKINEKFFSYFKVSSKTKVAVVLKEIKKATVGFIQAQLILSTVTYLISLLGLVILGVNYALAIALFIVIVDLLPILGSGSALVPWAILAFTRGETFLSIGLIILFIVILVVRRIIEPKILGEKLGLSPLITLISIWVGYKVLGIAGVFLGPLFFILYHALVKAKVIRFKIKI